VSIAIAIGEWLTTPQRTWADSPGFDSERGEGVPDVDGDAVHFMATMVSLNRGKLHIATNEFCEIDIVGGQQRLATLIILYKSRPEG
jgi:hypothetical protein